MSAKFPGGGEAGSFLAGSLLSLNCWIWLVAMANERLIFLAYNIYSILAEYNLHRCTFRWALWPMGLWSYTLKTIWWMIIILGILGQCDTNIDLKLSMFVSDLYVMVQWFFLISWRQPIWWANAIIGIKVQCDAKIYLIKCMGQWYTIHGPVLLFYMMDECCTWDIDFCLYLFVDMKMFVNVARLDIGQLFTQGARGRHPCTLDTFLVVFIFISFKPVRASRTTLFSNYFYCTTLSAEHFSCIDKSMDDGGDPREPNG